MSFLIVLNLTLALTTLDQARSTTFFKWSHFEETSSANGIVTFQPAGARLHANVKVIVKADAYGAIENAKLELKRNSIDVPQARELTKDFLRQALAAEDPAHRDQVIRKISTLSQPGHFESRLPSGALVTVDEEDGWLVIFTGRSDGPKLGSPFTSYKIKGE
jgi:hypothetical protein